MSAPRLKSFKQIEIEIVIFMFQGPCESKSPDFIFVIHRA